jgi:hypothetical protein
MNTDEHEIMILFQPLAFSFQPLNAGYPGSSQACQRRLVSAKFRNAGRRRKRSEDGSVWGRAARFNTG